MIRLFTCIAMLAAAFLICLCCTGAPGTIHTSASGSMGLGYQLAAVLGLFKEYGGAAACGDDATGDCLRMGRVGCATTTRAPKPESQVSPASSTAQRPSAVAAAAEDAFSVTETPLRCFAEAEIAR